MWFRIPELSDALPEPVEEHAFPMVTKLLRKSAHVCQDNYRGTARRFAEITIGKFSTADDTDDADWEKSWVGRDSNPEPTPKAFGAALPIEQLQY